MKSTGLLITKNFQDIDNAKNLGIPSPEPQYAKTSFLFRKSDVKNVAIDGNKLIVDFYNEETYMFEYDQIMWDELEKYFTANDI